jgi:hypothetical protein
VEAQEEQEQEDPNLDNHQRFEALTCLSLLELKFSTLREKIYVDKMNMITWEEGLVLVCALILITTARLMFYAIKGRDTSRTPFPFRRAHTEERS